MRNIRFFDTTLRDGEQMPGVHLSRAQKLELARRISAMGADIIEAGFPASSEGDAACVTAIANAVGDNTVVCGLARCSRSDIDAAYNAVRGAAKARIHVFIATSDLHIEHKLNMTRDEVLDKIRDSVSYARSLCADIEFSAEDASRSDPDYLIRAYKLAVECGAGTINVPDTVGYAMPLEFGRLIAMVKAALPEGIIISAHCHNDLGCAVANSLAAVENGAEQIECTVGGVGERAGNAALEEIAMAIYTRADYYGAEYKLDTTQLTRTARLVSSLFGAAIPANKPVTGGNAFSHESGIHQHGMLCDKRTYQILTPESVGLSSSNMVLGKLSGRHAFAQRLRELGYAGLDEHAVNECFVVFKRLADKKNICDEDIMAIVNEYLDSLESVYELDSFQIQCGNKSKAMAMVTLSCRGASVSEAAIGDGPINAAFNAVTRLSGADSITLDEYSIKAVTEGADALGEAMVKITVSGAGYSGRSASTDIIEASVKAYVNALNKWAKQER